MVAVLSVLVILALSILVTRVATVALTHTGLSRDAAAFQSRSAFTGVGFTTSEAESAVNHPVRRRIIGLLMLLGNVGIVTSVSSLILGFVNVDEGEISRFERISLLAGGVTVLLVLARSAFVDRWLSRAISRALDRWTDLEIRDYEELLHLTGDYRVRELRVRPEDWLADSTLGELGLRDEGITVLGIERENGDYVGAPLGTTRIQPHDLLILYGRAAAIHQLDQRRKGASGDAEHRSAVAEEEALRRSEAAREAARDG